MIEYAIVLLTDLEDIREACRIDVQFGTARLSLDGDIVRAFVKCTNHAYYDYPFDNCLGYGLELVPPELRPIFEYLFETLKETIVWNEQGNIFE